MFEVLLCFILVGMLSNNHHKFHLKFLIQIIKLIKLNLLPLSSDDYRLPIISRLFGLLSSNDSIGIYDHNAKYVSFDFNFRNKMDAMQFENV